eukprot:scaffold49132_cov77-Cyclotella_meneghiniana.AAC.5
MLVCGMLVRVLALVLEIFGKLTSAKAILKDQWNNQELHLPKRGWTSARYLLEPGQPQDEREKY